jgi:4-amino-4-deoxy-L-arabinose transferase-like glycosyltransferase
MFPAVIRNKDWVILALFLMALLLFQLGGRGLNEPDEGRYANIAQENLEGDHPWWDPQLSDVGHYDKPPLIYWVTALGFRLFGVNEWIARLPSLAGALLTLGGLGWAAARLYGPRVAWLTVLVAGTTLQIWALARFLSPDMFLTGWCTLAIAAWVETRQRRGAWGWWMLQVLFWTLAGWTKATPALIPLLGLAVYVYFGGGSEERRALRLPLLLPLILVLSLPWYFFILQRHPRLMDFFLNREMLARITGHIHGRQGPIYYYLVVNLAAWLPWWPLAAIALWRQRKTVDFRANRWKTFLSPELCILAIGLCVFSLVGSKLPTYTLTLAPWAALVMARLVAGERLFFRAPVLVAVAGGTALVYVVLILLAPSHQSGWGRNSSLKNITEFLHRQGATGIHADHFWPSLEFYWGESTYYTGVMPPLEVDDKTDDPREHFEEAFTPVIRKGDWFIHYRLQIASPYYKWLNDPAVPKTRIGDFIVGALL